jgi:hypothetical protein
MISVGRHAGNSEKEPMVACWAKALTVLSMKFTRHVFFTGPSEKKLLFSDNFLVFYEFVKG